MELDFPCEIDWYKGYFQDVMTSLKAAPQSNFKLYL